MTLRRKIVSLTLCLLLLFAASAAASLLLQSKISEQFSGVGRPRSPGEVALPEVFTMGTKARVEPPAVDPKRVQAILDADKPK